LQCRTLFATHYYELTSLSDTLPHVACFTLQIKEWAGKIIFLHNIVSGAASSSYGIHVAEMAGLPSIVTQRATVLLQALNAQQHDGFIAPTESKIFETAPETPQALQELAALDLNNLTPLQALHELARLKTLLG
jgi:DNA mismatch repair protein MutS